MNRREFVQRLGMSSAMTLLGAWAPGCSTGAHREGATLRVAPFELEEITVAELHRGMASGRFTATGLAKAYLERIAAVDQRGPQLKSVIELNPDVLAIAEERERERRTKGPRGPLHGIPILIKDNIDTGDRLST